MGGWRAVRRGIRRLAPRRSPGPMGAGKSSRIWSSTARSTTCRPKGIVEWTWIIVPGGFKEDTWVTSVEVKPSEPAVTHHICLAYLPPDSKTTYFTQSARRVPRDDDGNENQRRTRRPPAGDAAGSRAARWGAGRGAGAASGGALQHGHRHPVAAATASRSATSRGACRRTSGRSTRRS
jgi:hypothetical protein